MNILCLISLYFTGFQQSPLHYCTLYLQYTIIITHSLCLLCVHNIILYDVCVCVFFCDDDEIIFHQSHTTHSTNYQYNRLISESEWISESISRLFKQV
jgi:tRNA(Arg) A34 adenosine deaminase TadA